MAIKSVQAIVNGVTTTLTYDSASKTYKATLTAPAKSSYNQSGHYYGVQIIAKDEAGNTTTVNQSDATLGSKLRLTVKEKNRTGYHNLFSDSITVTYEQSADNFIHSHR